MTEDELRALSLSEMHEQVLGTFEKITNIYATLSGGRMRSRPLVGGVFGIAGFSLCSHAYVENGLDCVTYLVCESESLFVISSADDKASALSAAREVLNFGPLFPLGKKIADFKKKKAEAVAAIELQRNADAAEFHRTFKARRTDTVKSIPKRRQKIFEESGGKCHYCSTALTLEGRWHIEHKMPKALGGDNAPGNLVASCAPCNHEKRDTTDQEFIAKRGKRVAA